jgi:hypothetical protein
MRMPDGDVFGYNDAWSYDMKSFSISNEITVSFSVLRFSLSRLWVYLTTPLVL